MAGSASPLPRQSFFPLKNVWTVPQNEEKQEDHKMYLVGHGSTDYRSVYVCLVRALRGALVWLRPSCKDFGLRLQI